MDNISVHIGAVELKGILFNEILPKWLEYGKNFPLLIHQVIMRNKDWVEMRAKSPDCDAIFSSGFYKEGKKGGAPVFKGGRALVYLHVPNSVYDKYLDWCEKEELESGNIDHQASPPI